MGRSGVLAAALRLLPGAPDPPAWRLAARPSSVPGAGAGAYVVGRDLSHQEGSDGPRRQTHAASALVVALGAAEGGGRQLPTLMV